MLRGYPGVPPSQTRFGVPGAATACVLLEAMTVRSPLLLVAAGAAGLWGCGSGDTRTVTETRTVTTPGAASAKDSARGSRQPSAGGRSGPTVRLRTFQTPSRNIGCVLVGGARCDIKKREWAPPAQPASCALDWGQGLQVGKTGAAGVVCAGDTALNTGPILRYGSSSRVGTFTCTSRVKGMTCRNRVTGHGFFLARDRYRLF